MISLVIFTACGGGDTETETVTHSAATMTGEGVLIEDMEMPSISDISEMSDVSLTERNNK